ncbi:MAG TPA: thioredoxin family protein [Acidimicrobiales bacterium]
MTPLELTDDTFDEVVAGVAMPVLVDFTASWCPPCRLMDPILRALAAEHGGRLLVASVDVDRNPALVRRFAVMSMPTFALFVDGVEQRRLVGARGKGQLEKEIAEVLALTGMEAFPSCPSPALRSRTR